MYRCLLRAFRRLSMKLRSVYSFILVLGVVLGSSGAMAVSAAPATSGVSQAAATTASQNYLIVYTGLSIPAGAASAISTAGGTILNQWSAIGVVLARSASSTFAGTLMQNRAVL